MFKNITDWLLHNRPAKNAPKYVPVADPIVRYAVVVNGEYGKFAAEVFYTPEAAEVRKREYLLNSIGKDVEVYPLVQCRETHSRVR